MIKLQNNYAITSSGGSFALVTFVKGKDKEGNGVDLMTKENYEDAIMRMYNFCISSNHPAQIREQFSQDLDFLAKLAEEHFEEKTETNYEHFEDEIKDTQFDFAVRDGKVVPCKDCCCDECFLNDSSITCDLMRIKWSLQRHVEKVELTQFEYDLLRTNSLSHDRKIGSFATYRNLKEIGYFKDINFDLTIDEVLSNCEVVG